ncbi:unnamed protein product [Pieris brassicae]|uniref:Tyrosine specific protein phosphatases domain-containing protein n=1 Tax=Pieris brassicae TaxID=7116 RepID=A0A9P0TT81_PIEBR|nr:unnamed protein product [Pieris brassicae]
MAPKIPDRWIPYKALGKVIEGTRIICFKVPLRRIVQAHNTNIKEIWDIKTLLFEIPKLRAVIDLTNTNRYYDPKELKSAGVLHKKILMPGRIIPPEDKVTEFMDTVDEFLEKDDVSLVGVHCTHGLNRTGYMVCRYLRDRLRVPATLAIEKFEKARGYKIERENYIADLLGKTPPPPDIGPKTDIKPLVNEKPWRPYRDHTIEEIKPKRDKRKRYISGERVNERQIRDRSKEDRRQITYRSPLTYEQEADGHIMRYGKRRPDGSKNRYKRRKSSTDDFDFRYDY